MPATPLPSPEPSPPFHPLLACIDEEISSRSISALPHHVALCNLSSPFSLRLCQCRPELCPFSSRCRAFSPHHLRTADLRRHEYPPPALPRGGSTAQRHGRPPSRSSNVSTPAVAVRDGAARLRMLRSNRRSPRSETENYP